MPQQACQWVKRLPQFFSFRSVFCTVLSTSTAPPLIAAGRVSQEQEIDLDWTTLLVEWVLDSPLSNESVGRNTGEGLGQT